MPAETATDQIKSYKLLQDLDQAYRSYGFLFYVEFANGLVMTLA